MRHYKILIAKLLGIAASISSVSAGELVWLEAERFDDLGGWTRDAQFIDQMGSPYLLAIGLGQPVKDATTRVELPHAGRWRIWVRDRDWVPEHHPGRFELQLNGQALGTVFGASGKPGWHWEDGGVRELAGQVEIRLHDLSGYYGRCDAIVLASDLDWTPPDDTPSVDALRVAHGGVSREVRDVGEYDVVVAGGGLAGCTAAVAAARQGVRVALVQNRPLLGGNASTEILVPPVGVWPHGKRLGPFDPRETGLVEEYRTAGNQQVREGMLYSERLLRWVQARAEPGPAPQHARHRRRDAAGRTAADRRAAGPGRPQRAAAAFSRPDVPGLHGRRRRGRGGGSRVSPRQGIAVAAPGTVGARDAQSAHHGQLPEVFLPGRRPSPAVRGAAVGPPVSRRATALAPAGTRRFMPDIELVGHQWMLELGGLRDTYADAEEIRDDLLRLIYGLWDHTKNHCDKERAKAANYQLVWVSYVTGKRENRRLIGDHVLTQNDIRSPDAVPRPGGLRRLGPGRPSLGRVLPPGFVRQTLRRSGPGLPGPAVLDSLPLPVLPERRQPADGRPEHLGHPHRPVRHAGDAHLRGAGPGGRHGRGAVRRAPDDAARRRGAALGGTAAATAQGRRVLDRPAEPRPAGPGPPSQRVGFQRAHASPTSRWPPRRSSTAGTVRKATN